MNEIKFFTEGKAAECGEEKQQQLFGVLCIILAEAADADDEELAWKLMNEVSKIGHTLGCRAFNVLYTAVAMEISRNSMNKEGRCASIFKKAKEFLHERFDQGRLQR